MIEDDQATYDASDPWWISLDDLAALIHVKRAQLQNIRSQLGNPFEFRAGSGAAAPVFIHAKRWVPEWSKRIQDAKRVNFGDGSEAVDQDDRLKKIRADREELKHQKEKELLWHVNDVARELDAFAEAIRSGLESVGKISREAQKIMLERLDEAEAKRTIRHVDNPAEQNGHAKEPIFVSEGASDATDPANASPVR